MVGSEYYIAVKTESGTPQTSLRVDTSPFKLRAGLPKSRASHSRQEGRRAPPGYHPGHICRV